jgi:hypothetical protein
VAHAVVLDRRMRDLLLLALSAVIPAALALAVTVEFPQASIVVVLGAIVAIIGVVMLVVSSRIEVTVALLAVYLGLLSGPIKLGISSHELGSALPDVLITAICIGAVMRLVVRKERLSMPPLSPWVLAFVGVVVLEAFNPKTAGILKVAGGFRQQLQWVPFFFFGYALMRTKKRLRLFFIIVGVCGIANAVVATYQTSLSPTQLASWGPGYRALFQPLSIGGKAGHARVYSSEGEARARPVGLGSDSGFSGGVGELALPFSLALFATWRKRKRWLAMVFAIGAGIGVLTGLGRLQVISSFLAVGAFVAFASVGGQGRRAMAAVLTLIAVAIPVGIAFVPLVRAGTFKRYSSLGNSSAGELATHKSSAYNLIPHELSVAPFGVGLGTVGAVGSFGGHVQNQLEGHGVSAETQYNLLADELGAPGLLLWSVLSLYVVAVVVRGLRAIRDGELVLLLAAACAPFAALIISGFSGPFETSSAHGPYFWFAIGITAYWFAGRRRLPIPASATPAPVLAKV